MSHRPHATEEAPDCWNQIGVWGDRSCPRLGDIAHCRNCSVYSDGGRRILEREMPAAYLDQWSALIAEPKESGTDATVPYLAFRVGQSWFALRARSLRELTSPAVVRHLPHQRSGVLLGLTAVRGEIVPCFSMHILLGEAPPESPPATTRFLVLRHQDADWVFPVDAVSGVHEVSLHTVEPLPATMSMAGGFCASGLAVCGAHPAGLLDEDLLVRTIERSLA